MSTQNVSLQPASRSRTVKKRRNTLLISFLALMVMILFFVYIMVVAGASLAVYYSTGNQLMTRESQLGLFQSNMIESNPVLGGDSKQDTFYSFSKAMLSKRVVWMRNSASEAEETGQEINQSTAEEWDERVVELLGGGRRDPPAERKKTVVRNSVEALKQLPFVKISLSRLVNKEESG